MVAASGCFESATHHGQQGGVKCRPETADLAIPQMAFIASHARDVMSRCQGHITSLLTDIMCTGSSSLSHGQTCSAGTLGAVPDRSPVAPWNTLRINAPNSPEDNAVKVPRSDTLRTGSEPLNSEWPKSLTGPHTLNWLSGIHEGSHLVCTCQLTLQGQPASPAPRIHPETVLPVRTRLASG